MVVISLFPAVMGAYISFFDVDIATIRHWYSAPFVGLQNYIDALTTGNIVTGTAANALFVSISFAIITTAIATPIGFLAAITVNHRFRGRTIVRGWFLVPYVIPSVVTAMLGRAMFLKDTGLIDHLLAPFGGAHAYWFTGTNAFIAMVAVEVWAVWPFTYILILSGLNGIDSDLYDAAEVDGVTRRQKLFFIVLPQIRGVLLLSILMSTIFHLGNFTLAFVMFSIPPPASVDVLPTDIYYNAFVTNQYGLGAAISVIMVIVLLIPGIIYLRSTRLSRSDVGRA
jgi:multiple sugar transport system permease protein